MKKTTLALLLIFLIGCKNPEEALHEEIKKTISTHLTANLEKDVTLDDLKIIKIDRVTPLSSLKIDVELLLAKHDRLEETILLGVQAQQATSRLGNLYSDISSELEESYRREYQEKQQKNMLMLEEIKANKALMDKKIDLISSGNIDSLTVLHYLVDFQIKKINPDLTFEDISGSMEITKEFKVFTHKENKRKWQYCYRRTYR